MPIDLTKFGSLKRNSIGRESRISSNYKGLFAREISLTKRSFCNQKKQQFFNDLASLTYAKIDLAAALELLAENFRRKKDKELVKGP